MNKLINKVCPDFKPQWNGGYITSKNGWHDNKKIKTEDILKEAIKIIKKISKDGKEVSLKDADQLSEAFCLIDFSERFMPKVKAWCVFSIYNPQGSFLPGKHVIWSGHHTKKEAEEWIGEWVKKLNREDKFYVSFRLCDLYLLKTPGTKWNGDG